jgi:tetratricopeptide (TPR) repeat protein
MTNPKVKTTEAGALFEKVLFILCLVVIALRATFTEAPTAQATQIQGAINDTVYSLCLSGVLIIAFLVWVLVAVWRGGFSYWPRAAVIGLVVFAAGMVIAGVNAANKRAAITSSITLLAPILMAFMLAGVLNSGVRIKILLIVITALGVVNTWQSSEQYFISNAIMLEDYKDDPNTILEPLGIEPGSFNHLLLEHRIMSKDVRAFFTTSNSAGSFAMLAFFAAAVILAERLRERKQNPAPVGNFILGGFVFLAALFGLLITRSKGAIGAFLIVLTIFALLVRNRRPRLTKNVILAICFAGIIALAMAVGWYGMNNGSLPGGNSMLVRQQYWSASARMFLDHALTGVGGGNFFWFYQHYKPASAPETISDPHCFVLSILTQYGIFGLLGFLAIVLVPLCRTSLKVPEGLEGRDYADFGRQATICGFAIIAGLVLLRPFIVPASTANTIAEKMYVILTEYVSVGAAFTVGFAILIKSLQTYRKNEYALHNTDITATAIFCGLLGVLIHNLADFAILEPGVLTAFCACLGCLIALDTQTKDRPSLVLCAPSWLKAAATTAVLIICYVYFAYALIPVAKSTALITEARRPMAIGEYNLAHSLLVSATSDDPFGPDAPSMNGRLYLRHLATWSITREDALKGAEQALLTAIERNPQDCKNYASLAEVYVLRAQDEPLQKDKWFNEAIYFASEAVALYPGDAELHFRLAQIAEEAGQTETALKHYKKAVEIEDGFREQFKRMYPGREVFSRMPKEKYEQAKERVKILSQKSQ